MKQAKTLQNSIQESRAERSKGSTQATNQANTKTVAVIGGGAAGMLSAIAAAREGAKVLLFDANDKLGRKIYATGNGRCNVTNDVMNPDCYNKEAKELLDSVYGQWNRDDLIAFFRDLGVLMHQRNGYYYPRTDQARTIVWALEREIASHSNIQVLLESRVRSVTPITDNRYRIQTDKQSFPADRVILTTGGMVSKDFGCLGDGYKMAKAFGHTIEEPVPTLVNLLTDHPHIKAASGVRCQGSVRIMIEGRVVAQAEGELQFTDNGISGIPVFQVSRYAARALAEHKEVLAGINFIRDLTPAEWNEEETRRLEDPRYVYVADLFEGLVPKGIGSFLSRSKGLSDEKKLANLEAKHQIVMNLMEDLGGIHMNIVGTGDFKRAQVTAGGIPVNEVTGSLESKKSSGLYLAGELLDVDGICGGYNLTFAMCSGYIAGQAAARS